MPPRDENKSLFSSEKENTTKTMTYIYFYLSGQMIRHSVKRNGKKNGQDGSKLKMMNEQKNCAKVLKVQN